MRNVKIRNKAVALRKAGYSYNLIAEKVDVSKSTLHGWLAEIPYTPNEEVKRRIGSARARSTEVKHQQKLASHKRARELAEADIGTLRERDRFMLGLAMYIGEGEKNENVGIINSDPRIIQFMVGWLKDYYHVTSKNLTLAIHLYPDNNTATCLQFWSKVTGIPLSQFGKTQDDKRPNKKLGKRGKLQYGTAHLRVKSNGNQNFGVLLSRRIKSASDIILEPRV